MQSPPTIVLLQASSAISGGATLLYRLPWESLTAQQFASMEAGVFVVGGGRRAFYSHAFYDTASLRFDPVCMKLLDPLAKYVRDWLTDATQAPEQHFWNDAATTLVIDNTRVLHGRASLGCHGEREIQRLMLYWDGEDAAL